MVSRCRLHAGFTRKFYAQRHFEKTLVDSQRSDLKKIVKQQLGVGHKMGRISANPIITWMPLVVEAGLISRAMRTGIAGEGVRAPTSPSLSFITDEEVVVVFHHEV